ncbi:relaxase/Mobilization nuclease domain protein, partial [gut metagenome]
ILINLNEEGFDVERVKKKSRKKKRHGVPFKKSAKLNPVKPLQQKSHQGLGRIKGEGIGSHSANREWEVGRNSSYEEQDRGHSMKI